MKRFVVAVVVGAALFAVAPRAHAAPEALKGEIVVSAAASLSDSFTALAKAFRTSNPKVKVRLNFASSATLVAQIQAGAPSDVIASADLSNVKKLVSSGHVVATPKVFATNRMTIVVKRGNPERVKSLPDLARLRVVSLCGRTVPCGVYATEILARSGVLLNESRITRGVDANAALGAVASGDADAAMVYVTDALAAGNKVSVVAMPLKANVRAKYGIAPLRETQNAALAQAFVAFVLSTQGKQILSSFGFQQP